MSEQHGEAGSGTAEQQVRVCEWPGCGRPVVWAGRGRPPRWCLEVVDGVRHTAVNAHRARGGAPAAAPVGPAVDGALEGGVGERPVSRARGELVAVQESIVATAAAWARDVGNHELRMTTLVEIGRASCRERVYSAWVAV